MSETGGDGGLLIVWTCEWRGAGDFEGRTAAATHGDAEGVTADIVLYQGVTARRAVFIFHVEMHVVLG